MQAASRYGKKLSMALDPLIEKLLVLQDRDVRRDDIVRRLEDFPARKASIEREIAGAKAAYDEKSAAHKALELKKRDCERRVEQAEEQRARFRTQQLAVKKNDEYAALEKQIEGAAALIDSLETEVMELMLALDESEAALAKAREAFNADLNRLNENLAALARVQASVQADLDGAVAEAESAKAGIAPDSLDLYAYVKTRVRRAPYIVPVEEQHCMGCHLKVSNDVLQQARMQGALPRCDSCGRIVYFDR